MMLADGTLLKLNEKTHPNCYLHRSDPNDVARVEHRYQLLLSEDATVEVSILGTSNHRPKMVFHKTGANQGNTPAAHSVGPVAVKADEAWTITVFATLNKNLRYELLVREQERP